MEPIKPPKSLTETAVAEIRHAIVSGDLALGSKLSEQRLSDTLGISRSPVRDALAALQSEGLVTISPKRGTFVFTPDLKVVDELCELRSVFESAALRLGIVRNHGILLRQLEEACATMDRTLATNDPRAFTTADHQFHSAIIRSSENRSLEEAYNRTISPLKALRTHLFTIMNEKTDRTIKEHMKIIEAVRNKDDDLATSYLAEHIGHLAEAYRAKVGTD